MAIIFEDSDGNFIASFDSLAELKSTSASNYLLHMVQSQEYTTIRYPIRQVLEEMNSLSTTDEFLKWFHENHAEKLKVRIT